MNEVLEGFVIQSSLQMKGRVYASCVSSSMIYRSETRPLVVDVGSMFERAEMHIIRWKTHGRQKDK